MTPLLDVILAVIVGLILLPFVLYFCAKMIAFGVMQGKDAFERYRKKRENRV